MIYTGAYKNCNSNIIKKYSISGDRGKKENFKGDYCSYLAPKKEFWLIWHQNIGIKSEYENNNYYIEEYYNQVLLYLNPEEVMDSLDDSILLCYEDNDSFCHRHIVAAWLELSLGIAVNEIKIENDNIVVMNRNLTMYKDILRDVIKKNNKLKKRN